MSQDKVYKRVADIEGAMLPNIVQFLRPERGGEQGPLFNEAGGGGSGALFPLFAPLFGQIPGAPWGAQALPPPPVPYGQITGQRHGPAPNENKTNSAKCCTNAQQDCIIYKIRNNNQRSGAVVSVLGS